MDEGQQEFIGIMSEFLNTLTDGEVAEFAASGIRNLTVDIEDQDERLIAADIFMGQIVHAHMIGRDMDLDALDFFTRMNALRPIDLSEVGGYSGYVDHLRSILN